jgi:PAS domain S-box-containing protein
MRDVNEVVCNPNRLAAVARTGLLDTAPEEAFDRLARLAARSLNVPVALVSLLDKHRHFFKSAVGLPEPWASKRERPVELGFCQYALAKGEPLVITNFADHELGRHPAVVEFGIQAYLGIPLIDRNGFGLGTFCIFDARPRAFTEDQIGIMRDLAASVVTEIELRTEIRERERAEKERQALLVAEQAARQTAEAAEHRFRDLVNSIDGIVWEVDAQTFQFHFVSERAERLLGYPVSRWLNERDFWKNQIHPEDRDWAIGYCIASTAEMRDHEFEYRMLAADGRVVWLKDIVSVVVENGQAGRLRGVMFDITAAKNAEQERNLLLTRESEARRDAETANRAKDEFLATVSHELRTPLTAILGWTRILKQRRLDSADYDRAVEVIERNAVAQAQLIDDILDVSSIITGKLQLKRRPVDVLSVLSSAIDVVRPEAEAKQIWLETPTSTEALELLGDPGRLQQVFWNLLSNAIKFTPAGGRITVESQHCDGRLLVTVTDTGQGIASEFIPFVFQRFRQADGSYTRRHRGLGLGLSIAHHIVELHGGSVTAQSAGEGQGATFTVSLPIRPASLASREAASLPLKVATHSLTAPTSLQGIRILVVDDEPDTLDALQLFLDKHQSEVRTASCASDAYHLLMTWRPDILISDIGMPGEDGFTLMRRLRAAEASQALAHTPAIALTAYARPEDRVQAVGAGYQLHVSKPVDLDELLRAIKSLTPLSHVGKSVIAAR